MQPRGSRVGTSFWDSCPLQLILHRRVYRQQDRGTGACKGSGCSVIAVYGGRHFSAVLAAKIILKDEAHRKRNTRILLVFSCAYVGIFGFIWAFFCHYHMMWDGEMISFFGNQFANGINDISAHDIDYITSYTQQLGIISVLETLYRIAGWENYRMFQALNAVAASCLVLTGYKLTREISGREETGVYFLLLILGCWPLIIYVPFIYGEVLSILFSMLSIYTMLLYLRKQRKRDILYMALAIAAACLNPKQLLYRAGGHGLRAGGQSHR